MTPARPRFEGSVDRYLGIADRLVPGAVVGCYEDALAFSRRHAGAGHWERRPAKQVEDACAFVLEVVESAHRL